MYAARVTGASEYPGLRLLEKGKGGLCVCVCVVLQVRGEGSLRYDVDVRQS